MHNKTVRELFQRQRTKDSGNGISEVVENAIFGSQPAQGDTGAYAGPAVDDDSSSNETENSDQSGRNVMRFDSRRGFNSFTPGTTTTIGSLNDNTNNEHDEAHQLQFMNSNKGHS